MRLQGKRVAVLAHEQFEDLELWYPLLRLQEEGAEVMVVGPQKGTQHAGKRGLTVRADESIHDVNANDFDAIVVPGGYSPDHMRRVPEMVALVRDVGAQGKPVAAICHAPWMLASAGLARGKRLTSFFSIKDDLVNAGAEWVDEEAVQDGNIITSRDPGDLPAFCRTLIEAMARVGVFYLIKAGVGNESPFLRWPFYRDRRRGGAEHAVRQRREVVVQTPLRWARQHLLGKQPCPSSLATCDFEQGAMAGKFLVPGETPSSAIPTGSYGV